MSLWTCARARREEQPVVEVGERLTLWSPADETRPDHWTPVTLLGDGRQQDFGVVRVTVRVEDPSDDAVLAPGGVLNVERRLLVAPSKLDQVQTIVEFDRAAGHLVSGSRYMLYVPDGGWAFDLHCPVHWIIHTDPQNVCTGSPVPRMPLAGDAVRLGAPWGGEPAGAIGVIGGSVGRRLRYAQITFNASTFRDDSVVSCSGGPGTIGTDVAELVATEERLTIGCWEWRYGWSGAGMGLDYRLEGPGVAVESVHTVVTSRLVRSDRSCRRSDFVLHKNTVTRRHDLDSILPGPRSRLTRTAVRLACDRSALVSTARRRSI